MPCDLCGHTMQSINYPDKKWWCPRCGSLKSESKDWQVDEATKLALLIRQAHDEGLFAVDEKEGLLRVNYRCWRDILEAVGIKIP